MLCACHRRSRASLHRLSFSMTCISWPVRLCSAADCSSAAATGPARSAVKCVDKEKGRSNGSFSLRPLSSLERFCVRHGDRKKSTYALLSFIFRCFCGTRYYISRESESATGRRREGARADVARAHCSLTLCAKTRAQGSGHTAPKSTRPRAHAAAFLLSRISLVDSLVAAPP